MPYIRLASMATLVAGLSAAGSCASPTSPVATIEIRASALSFTRSAQGSVEVPFTVTNVGGASVLLTGRCGDHLSPAIERRTAAGWQSDAAGFCLAINATGPVALPAGARRSDVVSL